MLNLPEMGTGGNVAGKDRVRIHILGCPVDVLTMDKAGAAVCRAWEGNKVVHLVTANVEMLHTSLKDRELAQVMREAELVTADGAGVLLAARMSGLSLPERVAGYDLMLASLQAAAQRAVPVFFLGAQPQVLSAALARAQERFPGLVIAGSHHGYFNAEEETALLAQIRSLQPRLLLVALGAPRQEKWIFRHKKKLPPCAAIGVGGSFDVLAGKARRAPRWMQRAGLEWLYRLLREPFRLPRMLVIPRFLLRAAWQRIFRP